MLINRAMQWAFPPSVWKESLQDDLVAESTGTPSNKNSALLTEARHYITSDRPERQSANSTHACPCWKKTHIHHLKFSQHQIKGAFVPRESCKQDSEPTTTESSRETSSSPRRNFRIQRDQPHSAQSIHHQLSLHTQNHPALSDYMDLYTTASVHVPILRSKPGKPQIEIQHRQSNHVNVNPKRTSTMPVWLLYMTEYMKDVGLLTVFRLGMAAIRKDRIELRLSPGQKTVLYAG